MTIKRRRKESGISRRPIAKLSGTTRKQHKALEESTDEFEIATITQIYLIFNIGNVLDIERKNTYPILKKERLIQGLSLHDTTHEAGVNVSTYWMVERYCGRLDGVTPERIVRSLAPRAEFSAFKEAFLCIE